MSKLILYPILYLSLASCSQINAGKAPTESNPFDGILGTYVFHDDIYREMELNRCSDEYYLVVKDIYKDNVVKCLQQNNFTIFEGPEECHFGISENSGFLPDGLKNCYDLCFRGEGDIADIHNVLYCNHLYYHEHPQDIQLASNSIFINLSLDQESTLKDMASALKIILLGPWVCEYDPWLPNYSGQLNYIAVCTEYSKGNCVEIYNCLNEVGVEFPYIYINNLPETSSPDVL